MLILNKSKLKPHHWKLSLKENWLTIYLWLAINDKPLNTLVCCCFCLLMTKWLLYSGCITSVYVFTPARLSLTRKPFHCTSLQAIMWLCRKSRYYLWSIVPLNFFNNHKLTLRLIWTKTCQNKTSSSLKNVVRRLQTYPDFSGKLLKVINEFF